ncbi:AtpZ/AtpI family protein [Cumulibacter manganitolerans]|uniref:AtpZ/AtpI family protein n=1 Tax=Cumulibacter manganitolerans TaxID=1884992 RepID=UPI001885FA20|nr:AtpZ/AtpI family protein [Cumulibacter manganitolerans]
MTDDQRDPAAQNDPTPDPGAAYDAMVEKERLRSEKRQRSQHGNEQGWTATGTLLSGIIVWGLIGWGLAAWTGWRPFLAIGVLLGAGLGVYLVTKQAGDPPPLMDISKAQDGGILGRRTPPDDGPGEPSAGPDEGHTR